jgi:hypothetical protein
MPARAPEATTAIHRTAVGDLIHAPLWTDQPIARRSIRSPSLNSFVVTEAGAPVAAGRKAWHGVDA